MLGSSTSKSAIKFIQSIYNSDVGLASVVIVLAVTAFIFGFLIARYIPYDPLFEGGLLEYELRELEHLAQSHLKSRLVESEEHPFGIVDLEHDYMELEVKILKYCASQRNLGRWKKLAQKSNIKWGVDAISRMASILETREEAFLNSFSVVHLMNIDIERSQAIYYLCHEFRAITHDIGRAYTNGWRYRSSETDGDGKVREFLEAQELYFKSIGTVEEAAWRLEDIRMNGPRRVPIE